MDIRRHYLGWDRPFSIEFAERLKSEYPGNGGLDECLVWMPSSRAGRHVLGELFTGEIEGVEAFHPPQFSTPAHFQHGLPADPTSASAAQQLLVWKTILYRARQSEVSALFPVIPSQQKHQWAFSIADQLIRVRDRLLEDEHDFSSVAASPLENDRERWAALATLEKAYLRELAGAGLSDPPSSLEGRLAEGIKLMPCQRLLIAGVLNLSKRQMSYVRALAEAGMKIDLYLPIPEEKADDFDEWGRPSVGAWETTSLPSRLLDGKLQRSGEPRELIDRVLELAEGYQSEVDALVLGAPDGEMGKYVVERSRLTKTPIYMPEGKALASTSWGRIISLISQTRGGASFHVLLELLRHSIFRKWINGQGCSPERVEKSLLVLLKERLIGDTGQLQDAALKPIREIGTVREFMELAEPVLGKGAHEEAFPEWVWQILQTLSSGVELPDEMVATLGQLEEILEDLQADFSPETVDGQDYWEILNYQLETSQYYPEREADERPVSGWLELPWEVAPHLVILGLPDNKVPGNDGTDAFLTPTLCRQLKLYGPDEAAAFHAFRLRLILESRKEWGKLDILLPDRGLDDDPELPSRFLFLADEEDILERVELLLSERAAPENSIPVNFGAQITLPDQPALERISVTDFSAYLYSPLHYLIERVYRWAPPGELPLELDAMRFGTLAHKVVEQLNGTAEGAQLVNESDISAFLDDQLSKFVSLEFGTGLSVPVLIQANAMRERLRAAAGIISAERLAGWKPVKTEWKFREEIEILFEGVKLSGVIDLVERNEENGLYRVVDYKTSDKPADAMKAHLMKPTANSAEPWFPECDFVEDGKTWRWTNLQLMLYHAAVERLTGQCPEVAYLNLAKAVKQVQLSRWTPTPVQSAAALKCAEAVVRQIKNGVFPVGKATRYKDEWLPWFGGDYGSGIHPDWQAHHMEVES